MELSNEEAVFYRNLYSVLSDQNVSGLLEKYVKLEYNKALSRMRAKNEPYEYGYLNGQLDVLDGFLNLKNNIAKIIKR